MDSTANLYNLFNVLVGDSATSQYEREVGKSVPGRTKLTEQYSVPNAPTAPFPPGSAGYLFINYQTGTNFNAFISSLVNNGVDSMSGQLVSAHLDNRDPEPPAWQTTSFFDFLLQIQNDPQVNKEFHAAFPDGGKEKQRAFFNKHLPTNYYGEQDAVTALMASKGQNDFTKLLDTMNTLVTAFNAQYGLCC